MPIVTSTVGTAITALVTAVQTQVNTDASASQILVAEATEQTDLPLEMIIVAEGEQTLNVRPFCFTGGMTSRNSMFETYNLDVTVSKYDGSYEPDIEIQRVYTLCGYVEAAVRNDPSLGGAVLIAYPEARRVTGPQWTENPAGLLMEVTIPIHCEASL